MWAELTIRQKYCVLAGQTLIYEGLLQENEDLLRMLKNQKSQQECIDFINANW